MPCLPARWRPCLRLGRCELPALPTPADAVAPTVGKPHACTRAASHPTGTSPEGFGCQGWGSCLCRHPGVPGRGSLQARGAEGRAPSGLGDSGRGFAQAVMLAEAFGGFERCRYVSPRRRGHSPGLAAALRCQCRSRVPGGGGLGLATVRAGVCPSKDF